MDDVWNPRKLVLALRNDLYLVVNFTKIKNCEIGIRSIATGFANATGTRCIIALGCTPFGWLML